MFRRMGRLPTMNSRKSGITTPTNLEAVNSHRNHVCLFIAHRKIRNYNEIGILELSNMGWQIFRT